MRTEGEAGSRRIWRYRRGESEQSFCFVPRRGFRRGASVSRVTLVLRRSNVWIRAARLQSRGELPVA